MKTKAVLPQFVCVCFDESGFFKDTASGLGLLNKCGGKIYGVYVYDQNLYTYICSADAVYEMHLIAYVPGGKVSEDEDEREEVDIALIDVTCLSEDVVYMDVYRIDAVSAEDKRELPCEDEIPENEIRYREMVDEAIEFLRGSPYF